MTEAMRVRVLLWLVHPLRHQLWLVHPLRHQLWLVHPLRHHLLQPPAAVGHLAQACV